MAQRRETSAFSGLTGGAPRRAARPRLLPGHGREQSSPLAAQGRRPLTRGITLLYFPFAFLTRHLYNIIKRRRLQARTNATRAASSPRHRRLGARRGARRDAPANRHGPCVARPQLLDEVEGVEARLLARELRVRVEIRRALTLGGIELLWGRPRAKVGEKKSFTYPHKNITVERTTPTARCMLHLTSLVFFGALSSVLLVEATP